MVNSLYQGMLYDPITGLYYGRARWYSASLGRWISQDPAGYVDGANGYQMESSGPVERVDALGLKTVTDVETFHHRWLYFLSMTFHVGVIENLNCSNPSASLGRQWLTGITSFPLIGYNTARATLAKTTVSRGRCHNGWRLEIVDVDIKVAWTLHVWASADDVPVVGNVTWSEYDDLSLSVRCRCCDLPQPVYFI